MLYTAICKVAFIAVGWSREAPADYNKPEDGVDAFLAETGNE